MSLFQVISVITAAFLFTFTLANENPFQTFIVEYADNGPSEVTGLLGGLLSIGIDAVLRLDLKFELFNGASFNVDRGLSIDEVIAKAGGLDAIKNIWPSTVYHRSPIQRQLSLGTSSQYGSTLRKRQDGAGLGPAPLDGDTNYSHKMCGVDKLHAEGYTGQGLFIGVIDTGIDYRHEALGGCFGPGCKVIAGYDLVGDDYNGYNEPKPKAGILDLQGHGTHVSGIIAADPNPFNFSGVVPDAKLGMWKVQGRDGGVQDDVLMQALIMAYKTGVDAINLSIGGPGFGWSDGPLDILVNRIAERGIPVVAGIGNNGTDGLFDMAKPADSLGAISVGAVENIVEPELTAYGTYTIDKGNLSTNATPISFEFSVPLFNNFAPGVYPLYITPNTTDKLFGCDSLPSTTPDLSQYVVLVARGGCSVQDKAPNFENFGAKAFLMYDNIDEAPPPTALLSGNPIAIVRQAQGELWTSAFANGGHVTVKLLSIDQSQLSLYQIPNPVTGGLMSYLSEWGPNYDGTLKPDVGSPGYRIISTLPNNSYAVMDGTSMASPYIAGVVGLVKQIRGKQTLTSAQISSLITTSAAPLVYNNATNAFDFLAPVAQQGGGLVDAYAAAHTTTLLSQNNIAINDLAHAKTSHPITIYNLASEVQEYTVDSFSAATAYTFVKGSKVPAKFLVPDELELDPKPSAAAKVNISPQIVTVNPGGSATFVVTFIPPSLDESRVPVYSGYVSVNGSLGDTLTLPYGGVAATLADVQYMDIDNKYPLLAGSALPVVIPDPVSDYIQALPNNTAITNNNTSFELPHDATSGTNLTVYPTAIFSLVFSSQLVRVDVLPQDYSVLPDELGAPALQIESLATLGITIPGIVPRNVGEAWVQWDGRLKGGRMAKAGKYRFLTRVLRVQADMKDPKSYESYESPEFEIVYS